MNDVWRRPSKSDGTRFLVVEARAGFCAQEASWLWNKLEGLLAWVFVGERGAGSMAILCLPKQTLSGHRAEPLGKQLPKHVILGLHLAFPRASYSSPDATEMWRF